jgi:hypothetical protein
MIHSTIPNLESIYYSALYLVEQLRTVSLDENIPLPDPRNQRLPPLWIIFKMVSIPGVVSPGARRQVRNSSTSVELITTAVESPKERWDQPVY